MQKIGIGVTTCNRPDILQECLRSIEQNNIQANIYINDDTEERKGVAHSKNKCLHQLRNNDVIFLIDDDVRFKTPQALDFILEGHERSAQHHFLFMHPDHHDFSHTWTPSIEVDIDIYNSCSGVFMSITKKAFETVGYFDTRYKRYGYEHAGYSRRIHLSRLNAKPFMMLTGMSNHFRALDFEEKIQSALSEEEKQEFSQAGGFNDQIYHDELNNFHNLYREFNG